MVAVGRVVTGDGGGGGSTSWTEVTGKPTTFPPATHTHAYADVTGKPSTFPPDAHTHSWASVTDKPVEFAPSTHTHGTADVTGLDTALAGKAASVHTHTLAQITDYSAPAPVIHSWNGSAYVADSDALIFIGPNDPGSVPDGSVWIDTTP